MQRLIASRLVRNVLAVASGTAAGQVVVLAFSPIITRIYSPEVFGLQGVFLSLVSMLSPVIALRYPMAIIVAKGAQEARWLGQISVMIAFCLSCLLGLVLLFWRQQVLAFSGAEALGALIWFLPLALFGIAMQDVADYSAARLGAFRLVGVVAVLQALLTNLTRVLGGLVAPVAATLVAVTAIGPAVQAAMLRLGAHAVHMPTPLLSRSNAAALMIEHRDFPLYRMPTDVLNAASQSVPVILLAALFSPAAAGLYALTRSVLNLPLNILGSAFGNVLYARFAELRRGGAPLLPLVAKATALQILVPGGALALAATVFPGLFALVFGEAWRPSGEFAQWMTLWVICMLANIPGVRALPVIGRQAWHLLFNLLILLAGVLGLLGGVWLGGTPLDCVKAYSVAIACLYTLQIATYLILVRNFDRMAETRG